MKWQKIITTILIITFLNSGELYAPNLNSQDKEQKEQNKERTVRLEELMSVEFSESNLRELLVLLEASHPDIVIKQMKLETSWFTSRVFKEFNNLAGMHFPRVRDSYSYEYGIADNGRRVAKYRSWQSSVLDYLLLVNYYEQLGYDSSNYYKFLSDIGYCEGNQYTNILKSMT